MRRCVCFWLPLTSYVCSATKQLFLSKLTGPDNHYNRSSDYRRAFSLFSWFYVDRFGLPTWRRKLYSSMGKVLRHFWKKTDFAGCQHCFLRRITPSCNLGEHQHAYSRKSDTRYRRWWSHNHGQRVYRGPVLDARSRNVLWCRWLRVGR